MGGTTGFYLLDNPNPHGPHYYTSRRKPVRVIVIHITASVEDQDMRGGDASAEQTARYAANTTRQVSWHAGADSDSWLPLLPPSYTAWHVRGYNSGTWGLEISKSDVSWSDEPPAWVEATLSNAADACRPIAERYGIPLRRLTRAQVDAGMSGFVYHSDLDPGRRFDPGDDFPIRRFFELIEEGDMPSAKEIAKETVDEFLSRDIYDLPFDHPENPRLRFEFFMEGLRRDTHATRRGVNALPKLIKASNHSPDEFAAAMRPHLKEIVGPVVEESVKSALGADNAELADAIIDELGRQLTKEATS